jgi:ubiquinone/menaquinone biosynthesis C-methylase UbiE
MNYSDITVNDPNFIKRYLQRSRLNDAVKLYPSNNRNSTVLDFGGGDGELCLRLINIDPNSNFICYEPSESMYQQAQSKIPVTNNISLISSLESVSANSIDIVYSLEVFEHLPEKESKEAFECIHSILKPGGTLIVGVPNELFIAATYKGIFRMLRRFGEFDAKLANILSCSIGRPPTVRPVGEISPGKEYHFHHLGFDHRVLGRSLKDYFSNFRRIYSPFWILGMWASPEIYYVVKKANKRVN